MAGSGYIQVPPDSTGKQVDMVSATVGGVTVARQVFALANAADGQTIAEVIAASASTGAVGVVVRPTTATVALVTGATVTLSGPVDISAMPAITGSVGINSIGTVTVTGGVAISGTAQVAIGTAINVNPIALSAGTANIGSLNHISRSVVTVVAGFYPNSAGATNTIQVADSANSAIRVNIVAGGTGGGLVSVTGTVVVAGVVSLGAGTANIGTINNVSATVNTVARLVTGGAYDNTAGDALKVLIVGGGTGGGTVTLSSGATVRGFFDSSAGSTTLVRVGDSANSALRVNVVAGGTGGGTIDRISATTIVAGVVSLGAGTANIGTINDISRTVQVAIGTPFTINNISAAVAVTGTVSLGAGTANIGDLNAISRTVQVAVGTPFTLQGISTTVNVAVATPFTLQGISTTVTVAGVISLGAGASVGALITGVSNGVAINISTMPAITGSIGINSISAGVSIAINAISAGVSINSYFRAPAITSASRGPTCATVSTSAAVQLIATPGAGANIYVTKIAASNLGGTFTAVRVGTSASANAIVMGVASAGGGFVMDFNPPWMLSASERAICSIKPNNSYVVVNAHFYVI